MNSEYTVDIAPLPEGKNPKFYQSYQVILSEQSSITFRFYKQYLHFSINGSSEDFHDATGLLGNYYTGAMISRDGYEMNSFQEFGFEWQVTPDDPKLFVEDPDHSPQLPFEQCRLPSMPRPARRFLRQQDNDLYEQAKIACGHLVHESDMDLCVDDGKN
jgi:hypothetical protein